MLKVVERVASVHARNRSHVGVKLPQNLRSQFNLSIALDAFGKIRIEFRKLNHLGDFVESASFRLDFGVGPLSCTVHLISYLALAGNTGEGASKYFDVPVY